jgi:drug/metabolite transporter (DMT)-like permease
MPVALVVLFAAALHATWNAIVKPSNDRLKLIVVMTTASACVCVPTALLVHAPHRAAWAEIAGSAVTHCVYSVLLVWSYRDGDFNQVYPVARGTAPPTVAIAALILVGENLSAVQTIGLLCVSAGLFVLATGRPRPSAVALRSAIATGMSIAVYTVIDGVGVRHAGSPVSYASWLFIGQGLLMLPTMLLLRRRLAADDDRPAQSLWLRGAVAGVLSLLAYGLVLWAQTKAPLAVVASLRETGVVFAAIIGAVVFREHLPTRRVLASVVIAAGAALLALG